MCTNVCTNDVVVYKFYECISYHLLAKDMTLYSMMRLDMLQYLILILLLHILYNRNRTSSGLHT